MNFRHTLTQMKLPKMNFIYSKLWTVTFFRLFAEKVSKKKKDDGSDVLIKSFQGEVLALLVFIIKGNILMLVWT